MKRLLCGTLVAVTLALGTSACIPSGEDCWNWMTDAENEIALLQSYVVSADPADIAAIQAQIGSDVANLFEGCPAMMGG